MRLESRRLAALAGVALGIASLAAPMTFNSVAHAAEAGAALDPNALITEAVKQEIRDVLASAVVTRSVKAQNERYGALPQNEIDRLDKQWRAERESDDKPLISMTLSNPLSSYLTRIQAHSYGLFTAIFVMDQNGLNVGQSDITGDFWQGDEAKFQKTFSVGPNAVFIDEPEEADVAGIWIAQVNLTLKDPESGAAIGSATFDVNLTELDRRARASASF